jgi:hypothetical protein
MQSPLTGPGIAIAQEYMVRHQFPRPDGGVVFLADYRGGAYLLEPWPVPPGWLAADWLAAIEALLEPWGTLRHDQVQGSEGVVVDGGQVFWRRSVMAGVACSEMLVPSWAAADVKILLKEVLELLKYLHDRGLYHGAIALDMIVLRDSDSAPMLVGVNGGIRASVQALGEDRDPEILNIAALQKRDLHDLAIVMLQLLRGSDASVSPRIPTGLEPELLKVLRSMLQSRQPSIGALARRLGSRGDWREVALPWLAIIFGMVVLFALWRMFQWFRPAGVRSPVASETVPMMPIKPQQGNTEVIGTQGFESKLKQALGADQDRLKELNLSEEVRSGMGSYYRRDYERWLAQLSSFGMSETVVETLTDTQFFWMFPSLRGKALDPRVLGQLWYGMAHDQIGGLAEKRQLAIVGEAGVFQDKVKLAAGQGKVYQIKLDAKQGVEIKLSVSQGDARLTVVNGELFLVKYSSERSFSVPSLPSGKTYQVIVTPSHKAGAEIELEVGRS